MDNKIKILIVEDVPTDAELIEMEMENSSMFCHYRRVETRDDFILQLREFSPDIIISDYSLPRFGAAEALRIRNEVALNVPFLLVTGAQTEEIAVDCIKRGADDYILKSSLTRLPTSVVNAIKKKKAEAESFRAVEELKLREEKYRNLFENSIVGMFRASSRDCIFTEANDKAREILGVQEIEGMRLDDFTFCNQSASLLDIFREKGPSIEDLELNIRRSDGSSIWISISARHYEKEGIVEGVIHDITNHKNSFIEMERANYELDRFAYHASHDLKSPLRSLEGLIQAAMEEDSIEEMKNCLRMMQRSTGKLSNLINDLLTIARTKNSEPKITSIDFSSEVQDCLSQLTFLENFNAIHIRTSIRQDSPFYTDAVRLRIILNNIISNAIKYHRFDQQTPMVRIDIEAGQERAVITIEDNGQGIAEKHISKIFDMFYRASSNSEGTGLGLYLVKNTIEKIGGSIDIRSALNEGTSFIIMIPNIVVTEGAFSGITAQAV